MYGLILLVAIAAWTVVKKPAIDRETAKLNDAFADRIDKLWVIAQDALRDQKYLKAEKALLTILRVDQRNAAAYNRLGILYAKQKAYEDAIECFEIAQSLEPNASSLHNVGLIYYETNKLDKALLAFEQAIEMEADVAARHIAYSKVHQKMGNIKKAIISANNALEIERTPQGLRVMIELLEENNQPEEAQVLRNELQKILAPPKKARAIGAMRKPKSNLVRKRIQ